VSGSGTCSGIIPGASLGNGREELAFPAPVKYSSFRVEIIYRPHVTDFLGEGRSSPRNTTRKSGGERYRPVTRQRSGAGEQTNRKPSYAPPCPEVSDSGANTVGHPQKRRPKVATVSQCGGPQSGGFERTKLAAASIRRRNRREKRENGPSRIERSDEKALEGRR
jgi:hypothetical protein